MAYRTEIQLTDFQNNDCYNKLRKAFELKAFRKRNGQNEDKPCSLSMIHNSTSDININKVDSNIVLPGRSNIKSNFKPIDTSKQLNEETDSQNDYLSMLPPNIDRIPFALKKENRMATCITTTPLQTNFNNDNVQNKNAIILTQWKVILNKQSQLIIRGIINCGVIIESTPIIKRLATTIIQSSSKHEYHLTRNIVDDEYELPDYIRNKFYNGFPNDWENIREIWKTYVEQGCRVSFCWPTSIMNSDDDLRNDITDITSVNDTHLINDTLNQSCTSDRSLVRWLDCDKGTSKHQGNVVSNYFYSENKINKLKDKLDVIVNTLADKKCPETCFSRVYELLDQLHYILLNGSVINNEFNIKNAETEQNKSVVQVHKNETNSLSYHFDQNDVKFNKDKYIITNKKLTDYNDLSQKKKNFTEANEIKDSDSSNSESEIYSGIPKLPLTLILRRKKSLILPPKRKVKKNMDQKYNVEKEHTLNVLSVISSDDLRSDKINDSNYYSSSVSIIEDEREISRFKKYINPNVRSNVNKHTKSDIIEGEECYKTNDFMADKNTYKVQAHFTKENATPFHASTIDLYNSCNVIQNTKCDINESIRDQNQTAEAQFYIETVTKSSRNINCQYQNHTSHGQPKQLVPPSKEVANKISKPTIISSVPVIDTAYSDLKQFPQNSKLNVVENRNKDIKKPNEKTQHLIQKESPLKQSNAKTNFKSISLSINKEDPEEDATIQSSHINSTLTEMSQNHSRVPKSNQNETIDTLKINLLSSWMPKVIDLNLIFEGNLINKSGHIVCKGFKTEPVLCQISTNLFETKHHEIYELVGDLNDTKDVVPKELLNQCCYGCPLEIEEFCKTWKLLQSHKSIVQKENDPLDTINVGVSSKGRRIIPLLRYWTGERITLKGNTPIYNPGTSQDTLFSLNNNSSKSKSKKKKTKKY